MGWQISIRELRMVHDRRSGAYARKAFYTYVCVYNTYLFFPFLFYITYYVILYGWKKNIGKSPLQYVEKIEQIYYQFCKHSTVYTLIRSPFSAFIMFIEGVLFFESV